MAPEKNKIKSSKDMKNIKAIIVFTLVNLLISTSTFAQVPQKLNYQAVARDLAGNPLISTPVNITFDILQGSASGTAVYTETYNGIINTNAFGLFTAEIGGGAPALGTFAGINWSANIYYLQVTVNGDVMPATQLLSVPYALHAGTATSGVQGIPGANGISIDWLGTFTSATIPPTPSLNQAYYNSTVGKSFIWDGSAWQILAQDGTGATFVAGSGISILGGAISNTGDLDSTNELISSFSLLGTNVQIIEAGVQHTVSLLPLLTLVNTADTSATNELQTLSFSDPNLTLSNGGGTVNLSSLSGGMWQSNSSDIYFNTGSVGIGTSSPFTGLDVAGLTQYTAHMSVQQYGTGLADVPRISMLKSRGASVGANVIVQQNDVTGHIYGWGADGSSFWPTARIEFAVDGIPGVGDMPGRMVFSTTPAGSQVVSERMRINEAGNVGIGTTAPLSKLDVNGQVTMTTGAANGYIPVSDANGTMTWTDPATINTASLWQSNAPDIYFLSGKVGIGLNAPNGLLHIDDASGTAGVDLLNVGSAGTPVFTVKEGPLVGIGLANPVSPLDIFYTTPNINASAAHITYNFTGGVGFGVNSGFKVDANNSGGNSVHGIYSKTTGTTNAGYSDVGVGAYATASGTGNHRGIDAGATSSTGNNYAGFFGATGATTLGNNYAVYAMSSGAANNWSGYFAQGDVYIADNVGIGTTTPTNKLELYNSSSAGLLKLRSGVNSTQITMDDSGSDDVYLTSSLGVFDIWTGGNNRRMTVLTNGNIGIGTTTPSSKLEVSGNVEISSTANSYMIANENMLRSDGSTSIYVGPTLGTGGYGVYVGYRAGNISTGVSNTFVGTESGEVTTSGTQNSFFGLRSGLSNTSGSYNTFIGRSAGTTNVTGSFNTVLGYSADLTSTSFSNSIAIGYNASVTASNQVRIGRATTTSIGGQVGWTTLSDARFKENIKEEVLGLDFITKLKPITYTVNIQKVDLFLGRTESDKTSEQNNVIQTGFLAQDVEKIAKELGFDFSGVDKPKNDDDYYGLRYSAFVVPLVKAVQEQQKMINELQENQLLLEKELEQLKNK
ncbi:MAG: hypothetical protein COB15_14360 [Flavobacteriales bacterium]|nr:MAG: hypothetical protein COB15_14360 [Flavobacteriales bacterium]